MVQHYDIISSQLLCQESNDTGAAEGDDEDKSPGSKFEGQLRRFMATTQLAQQSSKVYPEQAMIELKLWRSSSLAHSKSNMFKMSWTPVDLLPHICPPFPYP